MIILEPNFVPTEKCTEWLASKKSCLEITNIQREVTEDIRVTVIPFYLGAVQENLKDDVTRFVSQRCHNNNVTPGYFSGATLSEWKISEIRELFSERGL